MPFDRKMDKKIVQIDPLEPQGDLIARACEIILGGGVVIFPAKCLYGIAVDAFDAKAVDRVFNVKMRPRTNPLLVLINKRDDLGALVKQIPKMAVEIMDQFWPGDVTLVFDAVDTFPGILTANTGKIGIRIPQHPVARAMIQKLKRPMTGTSANISGGQGTSCIKDLPPFIVDRVDLILDAGFLKGGKGSTVVDVTGEQVRVLREGGISAKDIRATLAKFY